MTEAFDFNTNFLSVDSQEKGAEFEVLNDAGDKTGFFICLAGPDSARRKRTRARLTDFYLKSGVGSRPEAINRKARRAAQAEDRYDGKTSTGLQSLQMDDIVAATISWRYPEGFDGPACNEAAARELYTVHPTLLAQVAEAADDLDRFTKS